MSDKLKIELKHIDWMKVKMLSIGGRTIHLATEEGPFVFEFATEAEAKAALQDWFLQHGCNPNSFTNPTSTLPPP